MVVLTLVEVVAQAATVVTLSKKSVLIMKVKFTVEVLWYEVNSSNVSSGGQQ